MESLHVPEEHLQEVKTTTGPGLPDRAIRKALVTSSTIRSDHESQQSI